ncbi:META domain-containing protein [Streptomyces sp. NPDC005811]|uniref:META domain-containing protein n=1 Tax=Streptomyces sp. NPDC005811 TaxID=3154565 RepID=UPI0033CDE2BE
MERISRTCAVLATALLATPFVTGSATDSAPVSARVSPQPRPAPLVGVVWRLDAVTVDGKRHEVPEGATVPWIRFDGEDGQDGQDGQGGRDGQDGQADDNGTISGYDGCNHFEGAARFGDGTVTLGAELRSTLIACPSGTDASADPTRAFPPRSSPLRAETDARTLTLTGADDVTFLLSARETAA